MSALLGLTAILCPMREEGDVIYKKMENRVEHTLFENHSYYTGTIEGKCVVFTHIGVGTTDAGIITATLLERVKDIQEAILLGTAGGGEGTLRGDAVVGNGHMQHDLNLEPFIPNGKSLMLLDGKKILEPDLHLVDKMESAASSYFIDNDIDSKVHAGLITTGNSVVADNESRKKVDEAVAAIIKEKIKAIAMECVAFARACEMQKRSYVVLRLVSDHAKEGAEGDFAKFLQETAPQTLYGIVSTYLKQSGS